MSTKGVAFDIGHLMNSPCSKLQGITSAPLCLADKAEYNFPLNPSHAASSGEFKFKKRSYPYNIGRQYVENCLAEVC